VAFIQLLILGWQTATSPLKYKIRISDVMANLGFCGTAGKLSDFYKTLIKH
jgi:hypothetical protein